MGQTHDVEIDSIEQDIVFDEKEGNLIMSFIMKALEEKEDGQKHS
jgi:hypothetical protein